MVDAMSVGTKSTESMKEREPKFLGARGKEYAEPFATSESNDVARHSFSGMSKKGGGRLGQCGILSSGWTGAICKSMDTHWISMALASLHHWHPWVDWDSVESQDNLRS